MQEALNISVTAIWLAFAAGTTIGIVIGYAIACLAGANTRDDHGSKTR